MEFMLTVLAHIKTILGSAKSQASAFFEGEITLLVIKPCDFSTIKMIFLL
ncbi:MAG: hypothetical protein ACJAUP_003542 [Cellvibrionaceae bacterium]|jgi:hypothetical protein